MKEIVDYGVLGLLVLMSLATFTYAIERWLFYRRVDLSVYADRRVLELDLNRHLGPLATIGSSAPYIGLLGTVLAIILTFYIIGEQKSAIDTGEIMKNLALALKATAAGLVVAIPASVLYNILSDQADRLLTQWEILYAGPEE
ncbi:TonB-system energizer ExbB [Nitratifractor sp.]|uniref:TonB-system energizer ExbB n=1 Tax=Nitratifractor sp. TaxID=2268144 RepID=UPI0025EF10FA|nr:TonB-system energizer ExbB [Nitratifractor sp.]